MTPPEATRHENSGPLISIIGPTAIGKSSFAIETALEFGGEVISCDSMAVYRGLDIGTDKPTSEEMRGVRHHLIDVAEPGAFFSAGEFRRITLEKLDDIWSKGSIAIVVGGTGLYYRALTKGLLPLPGRQPELRKRLSERIEKKGPEHLHRILSRFDREYASTIGDRDSLRISRALEVYMTTGKPLSQWIRETPFGTDSLEGIRIGLIADISWLSARINGRVDVMMNENFLEEVKALKESGLLEGPAKKAIGYGELAAFLDGDISMEEAVEAIKLRSRQLAKRQLKWFRKEDGIEWFDIRKEGWRDDAWKYISERLVTGSCEERD